MRSELSYDMDMRMHKVTLFIDDIDFYNLSKEVKQMDYYELDKEKRWLESDSPGEIGGRDTDVSQIAFSLSHRVREMYPINKVPNELVDKLNELEDVCSNCEKVIADTINLISDEVAK